VFCHIKLPKLSQLKSCNNPNDSADVQQKRISFCKLRYNTIYQDAKPDQPQLIIPDAQNNNTMEIQTIIQQRYSVR